MGKNHVLRDVSLEVPEGCLYGLIGPGAAGKSVLLKMIAGLLRPDRGAVVVGDDDVTAASDELELQEIRMQIGMLFQNNALFDHLTVGDNIAFPCAASTRRRRTRSRERVAERLACVSLPGFEERMPSGLSRRAEEARRRGARDGDARADRALRRAGRGARPGDLAEDLRAPPRRAAGVGRTVVMVSSDLDRLLTVTDRVGMMYRGELIFDGTTEEARACAEPRVRQFVHGLTEGPLVRRALRLPVLSRVPAAW